MAFEPGSCKITSAAAGLPLSCDADGIVARGQFDARHVAHVGDLPCALA